MFLCAHVFGFDGCVLPPRVQLVGGEPKSEITQHELNIRERAAHEGGCRGGGKCQATQDVGRITAGAGQYPISSPE